MTQQKRDQQPGTVAFNVGPPAGPLADRFEFARFVLSGVIAAGSNFLAVWLARRARPTRFRW